MTPMQTRQDAAADAVGKLVVVIDDDPDILEAMRGLLGAWGYEVIAAPSDSAVLAHLCKTGQRPDLIISDYRLAEGQIGVHAIERLRQAFEIPAFIITGETAIEQHDQTGTAPIDVLHKPVDPKSLNAMLRQIFNANSGRQMQPLTS
jgi:two-component system, sensor histidine kinase